MLDYLGLLDLGFVDWNDTKAFDTGYSDIGVCLTAISCGGFSGSGFGFWILVLRINQSSYTNLLYSFTKYKRKTARLFAFTIYRSNRKITLKLLVLLPNLLKQYHKAHIFIVV